MLLTAANVPLDIYTSPLHQDTAGKLGPLVFAYNSVKGFILSPVEMTARSDNLETYPLRP